MDSSILKTDENDDVRSALKVREYVMLRHLLPRFRYDRFPKGSIWSIRWLGTGADFIFCYNNRAIFTQWGKDPIKFFCWGESLPSFVGRPFVRIISAGDMFFCGSLTRPVDTRKLWRIADAEKERGRAGAAAVRVPEQHRIGGNGS